MTEIFRAGIQAIPRGQVEAAAALGMTERMTMRRVVLPQATRIVIPAIGNEFIAMIKDSALVAYVGIQETFWRASTTGSRTFRSFETLLVAALIYWVLTIFFSLLQERLEKRMARERRPDMSLLDGAGGFDADRADPGLRRPRGRVAARSVRASPGR